MVVAHAAGRRGWRTRRNLKFEHQISKFVKHSSEISIFAEQYLSQISPQKSCAAASQTLLVLKQLLSPVQNINYKSSQLLKFN